MQVMKEVKGGGKVMKKVMSVMGFDVDDEKVSRYPQTLFVLTMFIVTIFIYFCIVSSLKIPIDSRIASKFRKLKSEYLEALGSSRVPGQSRLHDMNDRAMGLRKLGSNVNMIVDQVKSMDHTEALQTDILSSETLTDSSDIEPMVSVPISDYEFHSSHSFIQEYLKSLPSGDDSLKTSIKNYGDSLNSGNLRTFTEKVIQENKEDKDFKDWNFQRFGHQPEVVEGSIDFHEFQNYLIDQGFKPKQVEFLNEDKLTNEEIDSKLNEIMDQNRKEQRIKIIGENRSFRITPPIIALALLMMI